MVKNVELRIKIEILELTSPNPDFHLCSFPWPEKMPEFMPTPSAEIRITALLSFSQPVMTMVRLSFSFIQSFFLHAKRNNGNV